MEYATMTNKQTKQEPPKRKIKVIKKKDKKKTPTKSTNHLNQPPLVLTESKSNWLEISRNNLQKQKRKDARILEQFRNLPLL